MRGSICELAAIVGSRRRPQVGAPETDKTKANLRIENDLRQRRPRLLFLGLLALPLAACNKAEPVAPKSAAVAAAQADTRYRGDAAPRERREYSGPPGEGVTHSVVSAVSNEKAIEAEALRGGPRGEARIFENAQEQAELARGASPKYMNGQFRYYLVGVTMTPAGEGGCKGPGLAIRLAVENLHGTPTSAIYGTFTFAQSAGADGSPMTETVAVPYHADIIGPLSDKRGGIVYVNARAEQSDAYMDPLRWAQIAAVQPSRLKVFFRPEVFYYPDGNQYAPRSGMSPAARQVMTCGGGEGASAALAR
jgi:hypothetical protein